jgi:hypothetical protein
MHFCLVTKELASHFHFHLIVHMPFDPAYTFVSLECAECMQMTCSTVMNRRDKHSLDLITSP